MDFRTQQRLKQISLIILIVAGLNWGLVGLFRVDIVTAIFGFNWFSRLIYILIGVAAGYLCYAQFIDKGASAVPPKT